VGVGDPRDRRGVTAQGGDWGAGAGGARGPGRQTR
jgi:hypothetical protein